MWQVVQLGWTSLAGLRALRASVPLWAGRKGGREAIKQWECVPRDNSREQGSALSNDRFFAPGDAWRTCTAPAPHTPPTCIMLPSKCVPRYVQVHQRGLWGPGAAPCGPVGRIHWWVGCLLGWLSGDWRTGWVPGGAVGVEARMPECLAGWQGGWA